jgi:hypothetical protein
MSLEACPARRGILGKQEIVRIADLSTGGRWSIPTAGVSSLIFPLPTPSTTGALLSPFWGNGLCTTFLATRSSWRRTWWEPGRSWCTSGPFVHSTADLRDETQALECSRHLKSHPPSFPPRPKLQATLTSTGIVQDMRPGSQLSRMERG